MEDNSKIVDGVAWPQVELFVFTQFIAYPIDNRLYVVVFTRQATLIA